MKLELCSALLAALLSSVLSCAGQAPPSNDDFTNRTLLTGNDVLFSGTLAGATRETFWDDTLQAFVPEVTGYPFTSGAESKTVWWTWTATDSGPVIVQMRGASADTRRQDGLLVYTFTNPASGEPIAGSYLDSQLPYLYFTFQADAGSNYQIQLSGTDSTSFDLRLVATNVPFILEQPQSQAVSAGDSALFTVVAAGSRPFGYQWQFNGTNVPGETAPMLALDSLTTAASGFYQVVITNSGGATTSQVASLLVTPADTASRLDLGAPEPAGQFLFTVLGDAGRRYRVQSSAQLADWSPEASFPSPVFYDIGQSQKPFRSVVFDASGADVYGVPATGQAKFIRVTPFHAANERCNNNIKALRFAQLLYACDGPGDRYSTVTHVGLLPYFKGQQFPQCPSNGLYEVTTVLVNPTCSTGTHPFEER